MTKRRASQECGNCEFWQANPQYGAGMGGCHRAPPTPVMVGMAQVAPAVVRADQQPQQAPVIVSYFPPLPAKGEQSWCGMWEPKTEGEA